MTSQLPPVIAQHPLLATCFAIALIYGAVLLAREMGEAIALVYATRRARSLRRHSAESEVSRALDQLAIHH